MLLNVLFIAIIITTGWDFLGFPMEVASYLTNFLTKGKIKTVTLKKPLSCSLCMTFWVSLIYVLCFHFNEFNIQSFFYVLMISVSTKYIYYVIKLVDTGITNLCSMFERLINKIN